MAYWNHLASIGVDFHYMQTNWGQLLYKMYWNYIFESCFIFRTNDFQLSVSNYGDVAKSSRKHVNRLDGAEKESGNNFEIYPDHGSGQ